MQQKMNQVYNYQGTNIYFLAFRNNKPYSIILTDIDMDNYYLYFNSLKDAQKFIEEGELKH